MTSLPSHSDKDYPSNDTLVIIPSPISIQLASFIQPLFECLLGRATDITESSVEKAVLIMKQKLKHLKDTDSIFQHIPRCCLQAESFRRILSKAWLKDDLLTIFTNLINYAFKDNNTKFVCFNTTQTEVFLRDSYIAITQDTQLMESFASGNFSTTEQRISAILQDWHRDCRVELLRFCLQREFQDVPSVFIFLDHVGNNHYVVHVVHVLKKHHDWNGGVVTTYDHLFSQKVGGINVSIRRCLIAKFFGIYFRDRMNRHYRFPSPPERLYNSDGMTIPSNLSFHGFQSSIFHHRLDNDIPVNSQQTDSFSLSRYKRR